MVGEVEAEAWRGRRPRSFGQRQRRRQAVGHGRVRRGPRHAEHLHALGAAFAGGACGLPRVAYGHAGAERAPGLVVAVGLRAARALGEPHDLREALQRSHRSGQRPRRHPGGCGLEEALVRAVVALGGAAHASAHQGERRPHGRWAMDRRRRRAPRVPRRLAGMPCRRRRRGVQDVAAQGRDSCVVAADSRAGQCLQEVVGAK
mmetsp:Transcript_66040/g.190557  ORF Transcript_66040/g.190557 Transcript_66040/m.190557 type:complete len:203 (-) Transcript_66040:2493-3101(-)